MRAPRSRPKGRMAHRTVLGEVLFSMPWLREAFEGVYDVREDEGVDVAGPQEVEVLEVGDFGGDGVRRELLEHDVDVNEGVGAAVNEDDGGLDVAGWEAGDLGIFADAAEAEWRLDIVVV